MDTHTLIKKKEKLKANFDLIESQLSDTYEKYKKTDEEYKSLMESMKPTEIDNKNILINQYNAEKFKFTKVDRDAKTIQNRNEKIYERHTKAIDKLKSCIKESNEMINQTEIDIIALRNESETLSEQLKRKGDGTQKFNISSEFDKENEKKDSSPLNNNEQIEEKISENTDYMEKEKDLEKKNSFSDNKGIVNSENTKNQMKNNEFPKNEMKVSKKIIEKSKDDNKGIQKKPTSIQKVENDRVNQK